MRWTNQRAIHILVFVSLLCCAIKANCIPVSSLNLKTLYDASDLVIVGRVGSFLKVGQVPMTIGQDTLLANLMESSVEVVDILKGDKPAGAIRIQVPVLQPPAGSALLNGVADNSVKLLFLRKLGDHLYQVTDPHHPSFPGISALIDSNEPLAKVATVECQVISSDSASLNDRLDAIGSLRDVNAACIVPTLRKISARRIQTLSLTSEDELVKRGDTVILSQAIADALSDQGNDLQYLKDNILNSIGKTNFDQTAVPLLSQLIKSDRAEVTCGCLCAQEYRHTSLYPFFAVSSGR